MYAPRPQYTWQMRSRSLPLGQRTLIMGIVNVTPDSFSDGGAHATTDLAVAHALRLLDEGADILDIGGESTRPGAPARTSEALSTAEEQRRVLPVVQNVLRARPTTVISIDTYRAATARAALECGAEIINDVSGGVWDAEMFATCAELGCGLIVMHTRGLPSEWAAQPALSNKEVLPAVLQGLHQRLQAATDAGVSSDRIVADPGFGFGKRGEENWVLLAGLQQMHALQVPALTGLSRKGFLESPLKQGHAPAAERDDITHAANTLAIAAGTHILRVHDVRGAVRAAAVADVVLAGRSAFASG